MHAAALPMRRSHLAQTLREGGVNTLWADRGVLRAFVTGHVPSAPASQLDVTLNVLSCFFCFF